jgi:hypothetical protein
VFAAFVLFAAAAAQSPAPVTGAVQATVVDKAGAMLTDLRAEEVSLQEDGETREIKRVERDLRPLAVAVLVDASDVMGQGFLRDLADPVMDFLEALPAGSDRMLLTMGTPPEVVDLSDPASARASLRARVPFGKLSLYDGIAEACRHLTEKKGTRRVVVVINSDRASEEDRQKALNAVAAATPLVLAVQFHGDGSYMPGLDSIVKWSGGRYEQIAAASGVGKTLKKLLPELDAPWLVIYSTPVAGVKRKVDVKVTRKGTKVRVRAAGLQQGA